MRQLTNIVSSPPTFPSEASLSSKATYRPLYICIYLNIHIYMYISRSEQHQSLGAGVGVIGVRLQIHACDLNRSLAVHHVP